MKIFSKLFIISTLIFIAACNSNDPEEPFRLLWEFEYSGEPIGLSLATLAPEIISDESVLVSPDRKYTCLSTNTGKVKWQLEIPNNGIEINNNLLFDESSLFGKVDAGKTYYAINLDDGEKKWEKKNDQGKFISLGHDASSSNYIFLAGADRSIYAFTKDGNFEQKFELEQHARFLTSSGDLLYVGQSWRNDGEEHNRGKILAIDQFTQDLKWEYSTTRGGFVYASLLEEKGIVYGGVASGPGLFVSLDANTGETIWEREDLVVFDFISAKDTIFINNSLNLVALNSKTGTELWRTDFGVGDATDNIAYLDGYLYHSHGSALFILDAATGKVVHQEPIAPDGTPFGNVAAANGRVFVMSNYHLYAYEAWK